MKTPWVERTLILIKPDGLERGIAGEILSRFERKGLRIVAAKRVIPTKEQIAEHYVEHEGNPPWFMAMCEALNGPVLAVILEGEYAVKSSRQLIGNANPLSSHPGTIRADLATGSPQNLVHGADSEPAAAREITLWFGEEYLTKKQKLTTKQAAMAHGAWNDVDVSKWKPPKKFALPSYPTLSEAYQATNGNELILESQHYLPGDVTHLIGSSVVPVNIGNLVKSGWEKEPGVLVDFGKVNPQTGKEHPEYFFWLMHPGEYPADKVWGFKRIKLVKAQSEIPAGFSVGGLTPPDANGSVKALDKVEGNLAASSFYELNDKVSVTV